MHLDARRGSHGAHRHRMSCGTPSRCGFRLTARHGLLAPGSFVITADEGDSLTITLSNELAIPVSLVIPGQVMTPNNGPVWFTDIAHPYTSCNVHRKQARGRCDFEGQVFQP